ncbi:MAG: methionyl-tRNA formyltransferase [Pseudonocardia sp.]
MRIVLAAEEAAGLQAVRLVVGSPHRLHAVLTGSRAGDRTRGVTVASAARALSVPVLPADLVKDPRFADDLRREGVDVLLNIHSLHLLDAAVLAAPRVGCFNLHPGPLPEYAGMNVVSWALYNGETSHGVTVHWMAPRVDAGPVAFRDSFPLTDTDTALSVAATCARRGLSLIEALLAGLAADPVEIPAMDQDGRARRYFGRQVPGDGWIPWAAPARRIVDLVRACDYGPFASPWGRARTCRHGTEVTIGAARRTGERTRSAPGTVGSCDRGEARIAADDEWVAVRRLRVADAAVAPDAVLTPGDVLASAVPVS